MSNDNALAVQRRIFLYGAYSGVRVTAQHPRFGAADDPPFPTNTHTLLPLPLTQQPIIFGSGDFLGLAQLVCLATLKRTLFQGLVQPPLEPTKAPNPHHTLARIPQVSSPRSNKPSLLLEHNLTSPSTQSPPAYSHTIPQAANHILQSSIFPGELWLTAFSPPIF